MGGRGAGRSGAHEAGPGDHRPAGSAQGGTRGYIPGVVPWLVGHAGVWHACIMAFREGGWMDGWVRTAYLCSLVGWKGLPACVHTCVYICLIAPCTSYGGRAMICHVIKRLEYRTFIVRPHLIIQGCGLIRSTENQCCRKRTGSDLLRCLELIARNTNLPNSLRQSIYLGT